MRRALRWLRDHVLGLFLALVVSLIECVCLGAQTPGTPAAKPTPKATAPASVAWLAPGLAPQLAVAAGVRDSLARVWDTTDAMQSERGYCLTAHAGRGWDGTVIYTVTGFAPAPAATHATPYAVDFECPRGTLELHVHTPTTCRLIPLTVTPVAGSCRIGGGDAWICQPSATDVLHTRARGDPLGILQCDRHALVPYTGQVPGAP